jgi:hypothetical protein
MISELQLLIIWYCCFWCRLRELQIRLLTGCSKSEQCEGRGTSLESTSSKRQRRREDDTAGLAPRSSILMSDSSHASCYP